MKRNRRQLLKLMRPPPDLLHLSRKIGNTLRRPIWRSQFEALKLERRRDDAADQGPSAQTRCRLPRMRRNDALKRFPSPGTELQGFSVFIPFMEFEQKGRASQPDPDFRSIDPMPVGALARGKKKKDRACSASAAACGRIAPHFKIMPAFGMRLKVERRTDLGRGERRVAEIRKRMRHLLFL